MPSQALRARHRSVSQESVHQAERASSSKYQQSVRAFPYILILSVLLLPFVQATNETVFRPSDKHRRVCHCFFRLEIAL